MRSVSVLTSRLIALTALAASGCAPPAIPPATPPVGKAAAKGTIDTSTVPKVVKVDEANKQQATSNQFWWPERLDLSPLRQHASESNPMGADYKYAEAFEKLDLKAVKGDIAKVIATSQPWWPADYGSYGPFFIRMAWHSAGTYRITDGRGGAGGGQLRFEPLNSWPDNANLDKARRLLWPVKQKYGKSLSWADLMVLTGNVALESMGFKTYGFAGGRRDQWEADLVYWGPEHKFLANERQTADGKLQKPLGAVQMGLIYVNPQGPNGKPDIAGSARDIREAFGQMAMNDEETVALIAGGHSFGKAHGAHADKCVGPAPAGAKLEEQGTGWHNQCGTGLGKDAVTSGLEGAWTSTPTKFSMDYLANLFQYDWVQTKSPNGATQWVPKNGQGAGSVPDAHDRAKSHPPMMFTTDLALKFDPSYEKISRRFLQNPKDFELAFGRAWFKLTHRDMGPRTRYLGAEVPQESLPWQDPIPAPEKKRIGAAEISVLKKKILASGLSSGELIRTAWAAAASYRGTDKRGGANGARLRLAPEKDWAVNAPPETAKVVQKLTEIQTAFDQRGGGAAKVSLADLIVLGGNAALERSLKAGGFDVTVPFTPGRMDTTQEQTDVASFAVLEPKADAFRNYYDKSSRLPPLEMLVERANLLTLTVPEMTALLGGLRMLDANAEHSKNGVFTARVGTFSNDWFVNLLDMSTTWQKSAGAAGIYEGVDRTTGKARWTATPVDLVFGSHSELRAIAEVYAAEDGKQKLAQDFVKAWTKIMMADRFDVNGL